MITAEAMYDSFSYSGSSDRLWSVNEPMSGDLVAGLLTGFKVISNVGDVVHISSGQVDISVPDSVDLPKIIPGYYVKSGNCDEEKKENILLGRGHFGLWVKMGERCVLFSFSRIDFIWGFITMFDAFSLDFRDYIIGGPFTYNPRTRTKSYYSLEGYDIAYSEPKEIAPVGAFYTGSYESDIGEEDYI